MYSFVDALGGIFELPLDEASQLYALLHVFVLQELKNDVAFWRVRVEPGISLFVITFNKDYCIFFFGYFQIVVGSVKT